MVGLLAILQLTFFGRVTFFALPFSGRRLVICGDLLCRTSFFWYYCFVASSFVASYFAVLAVLSLDFCGTTHLWY